MTAKEKDKFRHEQLKEKLTEMIIDLRHTCGEFLSERGNEHAQNAIDTLGVVMFDHRNYKYQE